MLIYKPRPTRELIKKGTRLLTSRSLNQAFALLFSSCRNKIISGLRINERVENELKYWHISRGSALLEDYLVFFDEFIYRPSTSSGYIVITREQTFPPRYTILEVDLEAYQKLQEASSFTLLLAEITTSPDGQHTEVKPIDDAYCRDICRIYTNRSAYWFSTHYLLKKYGKLQKIQLYTSTGENEAYQDILCNGIKLREGLDFVYERQFDIISVKKDIPNSYIAVFAQNSNVFNSCIEHCIRKEIVRATDINTVTYPVKHKVIQK